MRIEMIYRLKALRAFHDYLMRPMPLLLLAWLYAVLLYLISSPTVLFHVYGRLATKKSTIADALHAAIVARRFP